MKKARSLLLVVCAVAALGSARATTVVPPTFDELVARAELIFQGTVTNVTSQWTGEGAQRHIVTYVTMKVEDALKGDAGSTYTLRLLGGTVGDTTMEVTDTPKFKAGDRDIVFVEHNGTQFIPLVGIMHGRFRVQKDGKTGNDVVANDGGEAVKDVAQLGNEEFAGHVKTSAATASDDPDSNDKALRSVDFKAAIKAKVGGANQ